MSNFKVMPWLRAIRDRNAEEEQGMNISERLEKHRREAESLVLEFIEKHPNAVKNAEPQRHSMVAEEQAPYGKK